MQNSVKATCVRLLAVLCLHVVTALLSEPEPQPFPPRRLSVTCDPYASFFLGESTPPNLLERHALIHSCRFEPYTMTNESYKGIHLACV